MKYQTLLSKIDEILESKLPYHSAQDASAKIQALFDEFGETHNLCDEYEKSRIREERLRSELR